jgi:hypothetical protein
LSGDLLLCTGKEDNSGIRGPFYLVSDCDDAGVSLVLIVEPNPYMVGEHDIDFVEVITRQHSHF